MTLPANSTFLPILDDLLSPDFRPVLLPAQTPQTPTDVVSFGGGKIITNAFGNITFTRGGGGGIMNSNNKGVNAMSKSVIIDSSNGHHPGGASSSSSHNNNIMSASTHQRISEEPLTEPEAAAKIQNWWKTRSKRSNSFDVGAERAKHSIRHNRTEDHIRYLEAEVNRLKSALSSERKIRSLQLEAIRSLWSQVQRISNTTSDSSSLMTRSVPNGLPVINNKSSKEPGANGNCEKVMSMSMNAALESTSSLPINGQGVHVPCSCSKEVQNLRESLAGEMSQLRAMIDQLTSKDSTKSKEGEDEQSNSSHNNSSQLSEKGEGVVNVTNDENSSDNSEIKQQHKRPFSLNLSGITNNPQSPDTQENKTTDEEKEQINDYADQMASKLVEEELKNN